MKHLIILIFTTLIFVSCKEKKVEASPVETPVKEVTLTPELQNYENEIMKIHDEVMPKMSDVNRLSAQLRGIKETGKTTDGKTISIDGLDPVLESLNNSDKYMSDWMKNYSDIKPKLTERQLLPFFQKELEKITQLRTMILGSIDQANKWLAAHPLG
ncbi:MAG TPA: hypothetical protein VMZ69_01855 [Saprospiraceae bacterium]|nr:hypothetical protein [Saprospiraceae bacterium]